MITEQISLDELDIFKVSIETKQFVEVDGVLYQIGTPHRRAYSNSEQDRILIAEELAEPYLSAVMAVWGDNPTVFPPPPESHGSEGTLADESQT